MARRSNSKKAVPGRPNVTKCIFAEPSHAHQPLSYEHVWGEWLKAYARSGTNKHHHFHEVIGKPGAVNRTSISLRAGDPLQSKVKIVCKRCNSEWMSQIQQKAKPFLIPLIEGAPTVLVVQALEAIESWCVMATMTGEYLTRDPADIAISQTERDWFRDNAGRAPDNWKVWIAHYQRYRWQGRWWHCTMPILDAAHVVKKFDDRLAPPNTQATTFVIGNLYVHAMSGDSSLVSRWAWGQVRDRLVRIVPPSEGVVAWPRPSLTDAEANHIATALDALVDAAGRSAFGRRMF